MNKNEKEQWTIINRIVKLKIYKRNYIVSARFRKLATKKSITGGKTQKLKFINSIYATKPK